MAESKQRIAVVTGANKGIGWGIVKLLAASGVMVVLTARDEKRGLEAVQKLEGSDVSDRVIFHQLDVTNPASIASLVDFIKSQFGKLDILVNNAGIGGNIIDTDALGASSFSGTEQDIRAIWSQVTIQTYELAEKCVETNYYGAKRMSEALIPLLQLSDLPRIVNVSSGLGMLKNIPNERTREVLSKADITEEELDELLADFLKDFKGGSLEIKGWPAFLSAYTISKVAMNVGTKILAKKYPNFCINSVCPGFVKTDINHNSGILSVEEGAVTPVKLALLPNGSPSGLFYVQGEVTPF